MSAFDWPRPTRPRTSISRGDNGFVSLLDERQATVVDDAADELRAARSARP
jgi:hypothetical protein